MERHVGVFRGEGERLVDTMQDLMVELRDNSLESVTRHARRPEERDPREERGRRPEERDPREEREIN
eukprot:356279-Karenia_brevis.AAC.1